MVRSRRLELPRPFGHSDLNAARLPVPPRPHVMKKLAPRNGRHHWQGAATSKGSGDAQWRPAANNWVHIGTKIKAPFTIMTDRRYAVHHDIDCRRLDRCFSAHGRAARECRRDGPGDGDHSHHFGSTAKLPRAERTRRSPCPELDDQYSRGTPTRPPNRIPIAISPGHCPGSG